MHPAGKGDIMADNNDDQIAYWNSNSGGKWVRN